MNDTNNATGMHTREAWLTEASVHLRFLFDDIEAPDYPQMRFSCGWPKGGRGSHTIGQCWAASRSDDGTFEIFISPALADAVEILEILIHELIHACDRNKSGHRGAFRRMALAIGLTGKMTATSAGEELRGKLSVLAQQIGPYPHARLQATKREPSASQNRWIKAACPAGCDYLIRASRKTLARGIPECPLCGEQMKVQQ